MTVWRFTAVVVYIKMKFVSAYAAVRLKQTLSTDL